MMRWRLGVRLWMATLGANAVVGCGTDTFQCAQNSECQSGQSAGVCQESGFCSFPDGICESGQRYGDLAGGGLAGSCVVPGGGTTTDSSHSGSGDTSSTGIQPETATASPTSSTATGTHGETEADTSATTANTTGTDPLPSCGDENLDPGELCDDGNDDNTDACTELCAPPSCTDGIRSGAETDLDCGGECNPCGAAAMCDGDSDCESELCLSSTCIQFTACSDLPPGAPSGIYTVHSGASGRGLELYCDNERAGGGWTLAMVASDDGTATWTYENRDVFINAETFGSPQMRHLDMKSRAASTIAMRDLLFVHAPSDQWASYEDVGDASVALTAFIAGYPTLTCSAALEGSFALTDGTIEVTAGLCDTRLYFNRGDLDGTVGQCEGTENGTPQNTFGPCFSRSNNSPCPFDDPDGSGFGPNANIPTDEEPGLGFGRALGLNTGTASTGENHLQLFVR